jgi:hypothetical protein
MISIDLTMIGIVHESVTYLIMIGIARIPKGICHSMLMRA